jgi:site-specific recombinase XerD
MHILFWTYKMRSNSSGETPLVMRITHNKQRINLTLDVKVHPRHWDTTRQRVKGSGADAVQINNLLATYKNKALNAYDVLLKKCETFTVKQIAEVYRGEDQQSVGVIEAFTIHISRMESRLGVDFAPRTIIKYRSTQNKLHRFLREKCKTEDVPVKMFDRRMVGDIDQYFRGELKSCAETVAKNMQQMKTVLKMCRLNNWMQHDPFDSHSFRYKQKLRVFLTLEEIKILKDVHLSSESLTVIRDIFMFQIYTGLAYADVSKLDSSHIKLGSDGKRWLHISRTKSGSLTQVPLLPQAEEILLKYSENAKCKLTGKLLPLCTNQVMNRMLKKVAEEAGLQKLITSHTARHSFATSIMLGNGVSMETTSKLLGHSNLKVTHIYAKITENKIAGDVAGLDEKLKLKMGE